MFASNVVSESGSVEEGLATFLAKVIGLFQFLPLISTHGIVHFHEMNPETKYARNNIQSFADPEFPHFIFSYFFFLLL